MIKFDKVKEWFKDAASVIAFQRDLESVESTLYMEVERELKYRELVPVSNADNPGALTVSYKMFTKVGMAKIISEYASDLPTADVYGELVSKQVHVIGVSMVWTRQEVDSASMAGVPLETLKAESAREAMHQKMNKLCMLGDAEYDITGLLNDPNVTEVAAAAGATSTNTAWVSATGASVKTAAEIVNDVSVAYQTVIDQNEGNFEPDTMILPYKEYGRIKTLPMSQDNSQSVLSYLESNFGLTIIPVSDLKLAFTDGTEGGFMLYTRTPRVLEQKIPLDIVTYPAQESELKFKVPVEARYAGVQIRYPIACVYFTGTSS